MSTKETTFETRYSATLSPVPDVGVPRAPYNRKMFMGSFNYIPVRNKFIQAEEIQPSSDPGHDNISLVLGWSSKETTFREILKSCYIVDSSPDDVIERSSLISECDKWVINDVSDSVCQNMTLNESMHSLK